MSHRYSHGRSPFPVPAALLLLTGASLASGFALAAAAWSHEAHPTVQVHDHSFDGARIDVSGCEATLVLDFDAPPQGYADPKNAVRNEYRFVARVGLADGRKVETLVFANKGAGRRKYTTKQFSTSGCWAETKSKIVKLDVNGCRGRGCTVDPFE